MILSLATIEGRAYVFFLITKVGLFVSWFYFVKVFSPFYTWVAVDVHRGGYM